MRTKGKQWTVALSRSEENSRSQGATNLNNKRETVDSGTLRHSRLRESKPLLSLDYVSDRIAPLMSLDYVPNTIAYQNTFTDWEYTLNSHVHLHRLGVYTQPTWTFTDWELGVYTQPICPFTDWEYTLNPHALCTDSYRTRLLDKTPSQIAVDEFRLRTEHDCLSKHLHRLGVYTQLTCTPSQIGSIHSTHMDLHRLGVYTQPTCPFHRLGVYTQPTCPLDWEYTLNPHAPYVAWEYTLNPHALYVT
ncbi:unnamed protein product [Rodentolepis nana]|uniref:Glycoprotein n=1 Tax=Rodentolepis nana TaxID=102285 RepID=A0A0R3TIW7_RODNA|nr:unnamed protein product [Rodentolepis nana]